MALSEKTLDRIAPRLMAGRPRAGRDAGQLLGHIAEVSKNARTNWFGLLALLAFVGVTLLGHRDSDFFALGVETRLPVVGFAVPTRAFFLAAAALTAALYIYLHLYLIGLWRALALIPQEGETPLTDRVYPWLLAQTALWYRNRKRKDGSADRRVFGWLTVAVSLLFGWGFGLMILAVLWWRSMAVHEEWLTLGIAVCFSAALGVGLTTFFTAEKLMRGVDPDAVARSKLSARVVLWTAFAAILALSWLRTEGGFEKYRPWLERQETALRSLWAGEETGNGETPQPALSAALPATRDIDAWFGFLTSEGTHRDDLPFWTEWLRLYPADLREAVLTPRPEDWQDYGFWLQEREDTFREDHGITAEEMPPDRLTEFRADAKRRWAQRMSNIAAPDLKFADLRRANLREAFLPHADLRGADLGGASLAGAHLQGASLQCWEEDGGKAETCTTLNRANLFGAEMQGADLFRAEMQGAVLIGAQMQGAVLRRAQMQGAVLIGAEMQGADLFRAEMQGADLFGAEMQGAVLRRAEMQGADLRGAQMQGAVLRRAEMQGAECSAATLRGAALHSGDVTCSGLDRDQLQHATGNNSTRLPDRLSVWSCLDRAALRAEAPEVLDAILSDLDRHPEETEDPFRTTRAQMHALIFCHPDHEDPLRRRPIPVGRWPMSEGPWPKGR